MPGHKVNCDKETALAPVTSDAEGGSGPRAAGAVTYSVEQVHKPEMPSAKRTLAQKCFHKRKAQARTARTTSYREFTGGRRSGGWSPWRRVFATFIWRPVGSHPSHCGHLSVPRAWPRKTSFFISPSLVTRRSMNIANPRFLKPSPISGIILVSFKSSKFSAAVFPPHPWVTLPRLGERVCWNHRGQFALSAPVGSEDTSRLVKCGSVSDAFRAPVSHIRNISAVFLEHGRKHARLRNRFQHTWMEYALFWLIAFFILVTVNILGYGFFKLSFIKSGSAFSPCACHQLVGGFSMELFWRMWRVKVAC